MSSKHLLTLLAAFTGLLGSLLANEALAQRPLTATELTAMYADKSWDWGKGHSAFFRADGGFWAWTGDGSYAEGIWKANNYGMLCFSAFWTSGNSRVPARTCFAHFVGDGGTIYQRKLPGGSWQVFAHSPIRTDDPINGLVSKNLVLDKFVAMQRRQTGTAAATDAQVESGK